MEPNNSPRRIRLDKMQAAELAIYNAMQEVEKMPADVRLTKAVILLNKAKDSVSDFIDGISDNLQSPDDLHEERINKPGEEPVSDAGEERIKQILYLNYIDDFFKDEEIPKAARAIQTQIIEPLQDKLEQSESFLDQCGSANDSLHSKIEVLEKEIEPLQKEIEQLKTNEFYTRASWATTTEKKEELNNQVKALSAIKRGLEKSLTEAQQQITDLQTIIDKKDKEIEELQEWKRVAIEHTPDYNAIGEAIGLKLGHKGFVSEQILPAIKDMQTRLQQMTEENERLKGLVYDAFLEAGGSCNINQWEDFQKQHNL